MDVLYTFFRYLHDRAIRISDVQSNLCVSYSTLMNITGTSDVTLGGGSILMTSGITFVSYSTLYYGLCIDNGGQALRITFKNQKKLILNNFDCCDKNLTQGRYTTVFDYGEVAYQDTNTTNCFSLNSCIHVSIVGQVITRSKFINNISPKEQLFYFSGASTIVKNCEILNNSVGSNGVLVTTNIVSNVTFVDCIFQNNTAVCFFNILTEGSKIATYNCTLDAYDGCSEAVSLDSKPEIKYNLIKIRIKPGIITCRSVTELPSRYLWTQVFLYL